MKTSSELWGESFDRVLNRWRREKVGDSFHLPPTPQKIHWTIAISRQAGAGGVGVARAIGAKLGWEVYDRELLEKIAKEQGIRAELLQTVDERQGNWLTDCLAAFSGAPTASASGYARDLAEVLVSLAAHGDCVIVGRGAAVLLPPETTLRVRLVAPLKLRIARTAKDLGLDEREAKQKVESTDLQRCEFVRQHFHKDPEDVTLYDLTINTSRFSVGESAELIVAALERLQLSVPAPSS